MVSSLSVTPLPLLSMTSVMFLINAIAGNGLIGVIVGLFLFVAALSERSDTEPFFGDRPDAVA